MDGSPAPWWSRLLLIALAGAAGTLARYGLGGWVQRWLGEGYPWGTLAVNALGCLLFGLVGGLIEHRVQLPPHVRLALLTGFLGALTTFSTYAFETTTLLRDGHVGYALANLAVQNLLGLALVWIGLTVGQLL